MKIIDIVPYAFWVSIRNQLLVKVVTDAGITGWGESGLSSREQAVAGAVAHLREVLVGKDPMNIGALWQEMYRSNYFEGGRVLTAAISAIDIALHDVVGQALGVPVYQLLGGKQRSEVPTFASTGAAPGESMVNEAAALVEAGWGAVRLSIAGQDARTQFNPRLSIAETAEWVKASRKRIGADTVLGVDYHHRLSVAEAASFCNMIPAGALDFLEEPIRAEDPAAYEALRKLSHIPFAIGEEFSSKWQFLPFLERGITQRAMATLRGTAYGGSAHFQFAPSRTLLANYAALLNDDVLAGWATNDLFWDRIVAIEADGEEEVFDLTVPGPSSWLADGVISHNSGSLEQDSDQVIMLWKDKEEATPGAPRLIHGSVAKNRNGPTGSFELFFEPEQARFFSRADDGGMPV